MIFLYNFRKIKILGPIASMFFDFKRGLKLSISPTLSALKRKCESFKPRLKSHSKKRWQRV